MNAVILKIAIVALAVIAVAGAKYILHLPDDNVIEKIATEIIEQEMSDSDDDFVDVDLKKP